MSTATTPPTTDRLKSLVDRGHLQFPLAPEAQWLIRNGHFETADLDGLLSRIAPDSPLHNRLLAWCNSPLFNWSATFTSLHAAALVIDANHLLRLAFLATIRDYYSPPLTIGRYSRDGLWKHGMAVGVVGSFIARTSGQANPADLLLAGALHDFGLLVFEKLTPPRFCRWLAASRGKVPGRQIETIWFGTDRNTLCEAILSQWGFPNEILQITQPPSPRTNPNEPIPAANCCLAIADYLCSRAAVTATGHHEIAVPTVKVFAELGLDKDLLRIVWANLPTLLDGSRVFE
ncbi:HDOD domain-containing protein [Rosistilla ulvae]|uniref:HDOD domain-containing protein n=1 Tax=Rosistilla ulvae TaxID=1930277 RepID=UPI001C54CDCB|nr:HDOD domain-containing protein [Rosistilla ulvae]